MGLLPDRPWTREVSLGGRNDLYPFKQQVFRDSNQNGDKQGSGVGTGKQSDCSPAGSCLLTYALCGYLLMKHPEPAPLTLSCAQTSRRSLKGASDEQVRGGARDAAFLTCFPEVLLLLV